MGIDTSSRIVVGFSADLEEVHEKLLKPFERRTEERSHTEDRFDPKTGKKLKPVKVVDEESEVHWEYNGQRYDYETEAVEAIASDQGFFAEQSGYLNSGEGRRYIFMPTQPDDVEDSGCEEFDFGGDLNFDEVARMGQVLGEIRAKLKEFGLDPGPARILNHWLVC